METLIATRPVINGQANPFIPEEGWKVLEHKEQEPFEWNPDLIETHLIDEQKNGQNIKGYEMEKEVSLLDVCNASFLDDLIKFFQDNPDEIPACFKPTGNAHYQCNIFWGTIYINPNDKKFVRGLLVFKDGRPQGSYLPLDHLFSSSDPAVVFKKN